MGFLVSGKSKKMPKAGPVGGQSAGKKQKGLFGAVAGGQKPYAKAKAAANKATARAKV